MNESVEDEAPPNEAAKPPPFPDWRRMITHMRPAMMEIKTIKTGNIVRSLLAGKDLES